MGGGTVLDGECGNLCGNLLCVHTHGTIYIFWLGFSVCKGSEMKEKWQGFIREEKKKRDGNWGVVGRGARVCESKEDNLECSIIMWGDFSSFFLLWDGYNKTYV